jgi:lipopolysaccharide biosynthesis glycosyltransferase
MKDVCITIDKNFIPHAMVMLESLLENSEAEYCIHIVVEDKGFKSYDYLKKFLRTRGAEVCMYEYNLQELANKINLENHGWSLATYFILFLGSILPKHLDKVLYLDCDLLVLDRINSLFEVDLNNYDVAGVDYLVMSNNPPCRPWSGYGAINIQNEKEKLGLSDRDTYINTGVLLINLNRWRLYNYEKEFVDFIINKSHKINFADQCIINAICNEKYRLDWSFNAFVTKANENIHGSLNGVAVAHSLGSTKPWQNPEHPLTELYFYYLGKGLDLNKFMILYYSIVSNCIKYFRLRQRRKLIKELSFIVVYPFSQRVAQKKLFNFTKKY